VPCCPQFNRCKEKTEINFKFRYLIICSIDDKKYPVEIIFSYKLVREFTGMALGDIVYTQTLFPGEKVKLATTDRRSSFTIDKESNLAVRNEIKSEETQWSELVQESMSSSNVTQNQQNGSNSSSNSSTSTSNWEAGGSVGLDLGFINIGGGGGGGGSGTQTATNESSMAYMNSQLTSMAESSSKASAESVKKNNFLSIGTVDSKEKVSGTAEENFESSTRVFENTNKAHSVSYYFYRINKCMKVSFVLECITARVRNLTLSTSITELEPLIPLPIKADNLGIVIKPNTVNSASLNTDSAENIRGTANVLYPRTQLSTQTSLGLKLNSDDIPEPDLDILGKIKTKLKDLLEDIILKSSCGNLENDFLRNTLSRKNGLFIYKPNEPIEMWTHEIQLPTPGVYVKGCLDECVVHEDAEHCKKLKELEEKCKEEEIKKKENLNEQIKLENAILKQIKDGINDFGPEKLDKLCCLLQTIKGISPKID
jgi:Zn-finger protein